MTACTMRILQRWWMCCRSSELWTLRTLQDSNPHPIQVCFGRKFRGLAAPKSQPLRLFLSACDTLVNDVHHDAGVGQLSNLRELKHLKLATNAHICDLATALTTMTGTTT